MNEFLRKFDTFRFVAPWSIFKFFLRICHFFEFKFEFWICAGLVPAQTGTGLTGNHRFLNPESNATKEPYPHSNRSHRAVTRVSERTQIFACDPRRADAWTGRARGGRRPSWPVWTLESLDGPKWGSFVARSALPAKWARSAANEASETSPYKWSKKIFWAQVACILILAGQCKLISVSCNNAR